MARWVQRWSEEEGKYVLVPRDEAAVKRDEANGIIVRGNFDAFTSPVDGSLIRNHRELMEHNRRNGVVQTHELDEGHYRKHKEQRERFFSGSHSSAETFRRKQQIHEIMNQIERRNS